MVSQKNFVIDVIYGCEESILDTDQIYNLAEEAERQKAILRLIIPQKCKLSPELKDFLKEHKCVRVIRRV